MPGSTISAFSESDDFQANLRQAGCSNLLATEGGRFQARMIELMLHRICLSAVEESLSRVAFMGPAPGRVRISLPTRTGTLISGGIRIGSDEIATQGAGRPLHERLSGPCRWGDIVLPARYLVRYSRVLLGAAIVVPSGPRLWRPTAAALRQLTALHAGAMHVAQMQPGKAAGSEAARGLEQELIYALVECLSGGPMDAHAHSVDRHTELMARFEQLVTTHPNRWLSVSEVCSTLGVVNRTLWNCCHERLGMGPNRYMRLYHMQLARRALRSADPQMVRVSQVAQQYGFRDQSRFAAFYRGFFDEAPSATLQRSLGR